MNRSDVLKTFHSMVRDVIAFELPFVARLVILSVCHSVETESDVLDRLPTLYRLLATKLATNPPNCGRVVHAATEISERQSPPQAGSERPDYSERVATLAQECARRYARRGQAAEGARFLLAFRQATGLYSRLTIGKAARVLPWRPCEKEFDELETVKSALERLRIESRPFSVMPVMAPLIASTLFRRFDPSPLQNGSEDVPFRHGPGAVSEGYTQVQKGIVDRIDDPQMDWVYEGFFRELFPESGSSEWWQGRYKTSSITGNRYSRLLTVPKDFRGPRVIAAEPLLHQYVQQGISRMLLSYLQRGPLRWCVDLHDASKNGDLAREASKTGSHVTIDLKDASDLVQIWHVEYLFSLCPYLRDVLLHARTKYTVYSGESYGRTLRIQAFATMGSGLCFTIETIVFALVAISATWPGDAFLNLSNVERHIRKIGLRVYGDDIIVKTDYAPVVISALSKAGFRVNQDKTCLNPDFKESCGTDAFLGFDVAPLRPRLLPGAPTATLSGILETAQNFYKRGYLSLTRHLISYWFKYVQKHRGKASLVLCQTGSQLEGKPGVFSISEVDFLALELHGGKVTLPSRIKTWSDRTKRLDVPDQLRLRDALRGAPRDSEGYILDVSPSEAIPGIKPVHVKNRNGWTRSPVICVTTLGEWYRLTKWWK